MALRTSRSTLLKTLVSKHELEKAIASLSTRTAARMGNAFAKALKPYGLTLSGQICQANPSHSSLQPVKNMPE